MNIYLSTCPPKLRERIQRQINQDAAKSNSQPVAAVVRAEPQHREVQTLASRPQKQAKCKEGVVLCSVLIVRYGRKALDDDNLAASYKGLRDAIAAELLIDDGDPRITFEYDQVITRGSVGTHVLITQLAQTDNRSDA